MELDSSFSQTSEWYEYFYPNEIWYQFDVKHCRMKAYKYWTINIDYEMFFNLHRGWPSLHIGSWVGEGGGLQLTSHPECMNLTGLPLTCRLRTSQTSYPSNLEVPQESLGSPTFFRVAVVCPLLSRTKVLISVSHRIIMIHTSFRCVLKRLYRLLKFDRIFLESPYLYVGP